MLQNKNEIEWTGLEILEYTKHGKNSIISLNIVSIIYMCMYTGVQLCVCILRCNIKSLFLIRVQRKIVKTTDLERLLDTYPNPIQSVNSLLINPKIHCQE